MANDENAQHAAESHGSKTASTSAETVALYPTAALNSPPESRPNSDDLLLQSGAPSSSSARADGNEPAPSETSSSAEESGIIARFKDIIEHAHKKGQASELTEKIFGQSLEGYKQELATLRQEVSQLNDEKTQTLIDYGLMRSQLAQLQKHAASIENELERCKQKIRHETEQKIAVQHEASELAKQKAVLTADLTRDREAAKVLENELEKYKQKLRQETDQKIAIQHEASELAKQKAVLLADQHRERDAAKVLEADVAELRSQVSTLQRQNVEEVAARVKVENSIVGMQDELEFYERQLDERNQPDSIRSAAMDASILLDHQHENNVADVEEVVEAVQAGVEEKTTAMIKNLAERYRVDAVGVKKELETTKWLLSEVRGDRDAAKRESADSLKQSKNWRDKYERVERDAANAYNDYMRNLTDLTEQFSKEREQFAVQTAAYSQMLKDKQSTDVQLKMLERLVVEEETKMKSQPGTPNFAASPSSTGRRQGIKRKEISGSSTQASSASSSASSSPVTANNNNVKEASTLMNGSANNNNNNKRFKDALEMVTPTTQNKRRSRLNSGYKLLSTSEKNYNAGAQQQNGDQNKCAIM